MTIIALSLSDHAPIWMLRFIADGALGALIFIPNILGLICYACVCFFLIDKTISFADDGLKKYFLKKFADSKMQIGVLPTRIKFFALMIPSWLLKSLIGFPMLYVMSLIMSPEPSDIQTLEGIASRYGWQSAIFRQLPKASWVSFGGQSGFQHLIALILITTVVTFIYSYSSKGFDLVRRVRAVGDMILSRVSDDDTKPPTLGGAMQVLQSIGWKASECQAAAWFLLMTNLRITKTNDIYENLSPSYYGIYRVISGAAVASGLTLIHPLVAGLYLAFTMKKQTKLVKTVAVFDKRLAQLPQQIQQEVFTKYGEKILPDS